jgi:hypothetical protein
MLTLAQGMAKRHTTREQLQAYANWLNCYRWHWYAILTFRYPISPQRAWRLFNYWKIALKKHSGNKIHYFMVLELRRGNPHLHVLLSGTADEKPYIWEQEWYRTALITGIAKIKVYDPHMGVGYYLGKKLMDGRADTRFSQELPPKISERAGEIDELEQLRN